MWKSWSLLFWHFFLATISQPLAAPIRVHCQRAENTSMRSTAHIEIRTCIHKPRRRYCTWDGQNNNIFFLYAIHILYIYIWDLKSQDSLLLFIFHIHQCHNISPEITDCNVAEVFEYLKILERFRQRPPSFLQVPKEIWDEARSQLRVRLREIEDMRKKSDLWVICGPKVMSGNLLDLNTFDILRLIDHIFARNLADQLWKHASLWMPGA